MAQEKGFRIKLTGEGMNLDRTIAPAVAQHIVALVLGGSVSPGTDIAAGLGGGNSLRGFSYRDRAKPR